MATGKNTKSKTAAKNGSEKQSQRRHNTRGATKAQVSEVANNNPLAKATREAKEASSWAEPPVAGDHLTQLPPDVKYPYVNKEGRTTFDDRYVMKPKVVVTKPKKKLKRAPEKRLLGNEDLGDSFPVDAEPLLVSDSGRLSGQ